MSQITTTHAAAVIPDAEHIFDSAVPLVLDGEPGLPSPVIYDIGERASRLREVNFAAKRLVDMAYVSGLDWEEAMRRPIWRGIPAPGGLVGRPDASARKKRLAAANAADQLGISRDDASRKVTVTWTDPALGAPVIGAAIAPPGWGGIVLGPHAAPGFTPAPIPRRAANAARAWPLGDAVDPAGLRGPGFRAAVDHFFASSPGLYGLLVATPERVLFERYGAGGAPELGTPSWSMNKSFTGTLVGRLIQQGWLEGVHGPARPPLWRDPRGIHAMITLDNLLHMRSGIALASIDAAGIGGLAFENSSVYSDAVDAFDQAQRNIVATRPGAVFRYTNAGLNVVGAVIRDRIERRGLPYAQTCYELLADRLGMSSYVCSADIAGNLIASGSASATLRDYAKLGVLYLNDGIWEGERLLPPGWADYALAATHAGSSYAATFWTNADHRYPALPGEEAWMSGASDQRVFILRRARRIVAVTNESDVKMDQAALNAVLGAVVDLA